MLEMAQKLTPHYTKSCYYRENHHGNSSMSSACGISFGVDAFTEWFLVAFVTAGGGGVDGLSLFERLISESAH